MKNPLIKRIFLKSTIKRLEQKEQYLGINDYNLYGFLYRRLLATLIIFFVILFLIPFGYIIGPLLSILYYHGIEYLCFDYPIKKRVSSLNREAPYFLEILVLSLQSNLTLYQALEKTTNDVPGILSQEFKKVVEEVKMGKNLNDSLQDLQKRIPSKTLNNIILNIKVANSFGNNILDTVTNELEFLKNEEIINTKKRLIKIPFYVKLVSFLFIILVGSLIILLPIITYMLKS